MTEYENIIITELKAIREELTKLTAIQTRREQQRNAYRKRKEEQPPTQEATPEHIKPLLEKVFSSHDRIKRSELYKIEEEEAKAVGRQPTHKHYFFKLVQLFGYQLKKTNSGFYFYR